MSVYLRNILISLILLVVSVRSSVPAMAAQTSQTPADITALLDSARLAGFEITTLIILGVVFYFLFKMVSTINKVNDERIKIMTDQYQENLVEIRAFNRELMDIQKKAFEEGFRNINDQLLEIIVTVKKGLPKE